MDDFLKEIVVSLTDYDLNVRKYVPHNPSINKLERMVKRKGRRSLKKKLTNEVNEAMIEEKLLTEELNKEGGGCY